MGQQAGLGGWTAAHLGVVLEESGKEKSSQWAELWTEHPIIYFLWKEKWTKVRINIDSWADPVAGPASQLSFCCLSCFLSFSLVGFDLKGTS